MRGLRIVVSDNHSDYPPDTLLAGGASQVIRRPCNLGGDANIALGFLEAREDEFLWILSDNDPVSTSALSTICDAIESCPRVDVVIGERDSSLLRMVELEQPPDSAGGRLAAGLISGVIYRYSSIGDSVASAFEFLWTGWSQLAVQRAAFRSGSMRTAVFVPLGDLVIQSSGNMTSDSIERARRNYRHSFFGGLLLDFALAQREGGSGARAASRWWRRYWFLASAYRQPGWNGRGAPEPADYRQILASRLIRTGTLSDRILLLLSLPPYWRGAKYVKQLRRWSKK
jgi:hypothetical protein